MSEKLLRTYVRTIFESGLRQGGADYESTLAAALGGTVNANNAYSDVFVPRKVSNAQPNPIMIEAKASSAPAGEPSATYTGGKFEFSNKAPYLAAISTAVGSVPDLDAAGGIMGTGNTIGTMYGRNTQSRLIMNVLARCGSSLGDAVGKASRWQITIKGNIVTCRGAKVQDFGKQRNYNLQLPAVQISPANIVSYYTGKGAHYFQYKGAGLFSFNDVLALGCTKFVKSKVVVRTSLNLRNTGSGGDKMVIICDDGQLNVKQNKLTFRILPMISIDGTSNMDLDKPKDIQKFIEAL